MYTTADVTAIRTRICQEVQSLIDIYEGCKVFLVLESHCPHSKADLSEAFPDFEILVYKLIRLYTNADVTAICTRIWIGSQEVPSLIEINAGSWEFLVLESHCSRLVADLTTAFPDSNIDCNYDYTQPAASEVERWGYKGASRINWINFSKRAQAMILQASPMVASYYGNLMENWK